MEAKIVLIDDDKTTLQILESVLVRNGYRVFSARDGQTGLDLAKQEKPDVLISDMLLPKVHGIDVCKRIKSDPEMSGTSVILMTGVYKKAVFKQETRDAGADAFLEKPIDTPLLLQTIEKFLKAR
jgi:CheY-like chemotaxis protein